MTALKNEGGIIAPAVLIMLAAMLTLGLGLITAAKQNAADVNRRAVETRLFCAAKSNSLKTETDLRNGRIALPANLRQKELPAETADGVTCRVYLRKHAEGIVIYSFAETTPADNVKMFKRDRRLVEITHGQYGKSRQLP